MNDVYVPLSYPISWYQHLLAVQPVADFCRTDKLASIVPIIFSSLILTAARITFDSVVASGIIDEKVRLCKD